MLIGDSTREVQYLLAIWQKLTFSRVNISNEVQRLQGKKKWTSEDFLIIHSSWGETKMVLRLDVCHADSAGGKMKNSA